METLEFPRRDDGKTISDLDYAKLFAIVQQSIFNLVEFHDDGFKLRTENEADDDIPVLIEQIANDVVKEIGLNNFVKFLFYQLFQRILENETEFIRMKGQDLQQLVDRYGQSDVGYAISLTRTEDGVTEDELRTLVSENTDLTWEQYQEIGTEAKTPPKGLLDGILGGEVPEELREMLEEALGSSS